MQAYQGEKENIQSAQPKSQTELLPPPGTCFLRHSTAFWLMPGVVSYKVHSEGQSSPLQNVSQHFQLLLLGRAAPQVTKQKSHTDTQHKDRLSSPASSRCQQQVGKGLGIPQRAPWPALPSSSTPWPASRDTPRKYPCKAAPPTPECLATVPRALNLTLL